MAWMRIGVGVFAASFAVALWLMAAAAMSQDVSLVPDSGQETRTLDFGDERNDLTLTVRFLSQTKLPAEPTPFLTDPQTSEGKLLEADVEPTASLAEDGRTVLVDVKVTPEEGADPGSYATQLLLRAPGVTDARSAITINLDPEAVGGAGAWATLALLVGAGLGMFANWIATKASALKALQDRLAAIDAQLAGLSPLPLHFRSRLIQVRTQLANDDVTGADATLKDLEEESSDAIDVATKCAAMSELIAAQGVAIAAMTNLDANAATRLASIMARERGLVTDIEQAPDYASDEQRTKRVERVQDVRRFSAFLPDYAVESLRDDLKEALEAFAAGDFAAGEQKWRDEVDATVALGAGPTPFPGPPSTASPPTGYKAWLIRHAPLVADALTTIALVVLGLFTVYDPSETFRTDGFQDALELFAWGLGSAAAGAGVASLAGKLTAGRPASS